MACEVRATLGAPFPNVTNRNAVVAVPFPRTQDPGHNTVGVVPPAGWAQGSPDKSGQPWAEGHNPVGIGQPSHCSEMRPTLGFETESRWDSRTVRLALHKN
jgi:hypothetical protein